MPEAAPAGIDPRAPRFAAAITSALLLVTVFLGLAGLADPAFILLLFVALVFLWGVVSPRTAPWGVLYRRIVRPRLRPPSALEDPRPPRFAQGVGLLVASTGLALHVLGVAWAVPAAAAAAFAAAFLSASFGFCLGCMLYLLLQRTGLVGRAASI